MELLLALEASTDLFEQLTFKILQMGYFELAKMLNRQSFMVANEQSLELEPKQQTFWKKPSQYTAAEVSSYG